VDDAFELDGNGAIEMPLPCTLLMRDFSLSFYIRPDMRTNIQQVMTNAPVCNARDSLFEIQYFSSLNLISVQLADFGGLRGVVEAPLDDDKCWQQVTIVREGRLIFLYVNGELGATFEGDQRIEVNSTRPIMVGSGPCGPVQRVDDLFGGIDEIRWYDRALGPLEVINEFTPVDEVITRDTLIFKGDSFIPRVSGSCANNVVWAPTTGLSSSGILNPVIGPDTTTVYGISYTYSNCTATDQLRVTVVDQEEVDCDNLLLPTAFTPNGDDLNDVYGISNFFVVDELQFFQILDRNGNTLFEAESPQETWDGTYRGNKMPAAPYIYKVGYTCKGQEFSKVGSFNILR
jgi:gliding motility-associated-like protein